MKFLNLPLFATTPWIFSFVEIGKATSEPTQSPTELSAQFDVTYPTCDDESSPTYGLLEEDHRCPIDSPHKIFKIVNQNSPLTLEKCRDKCLNHSQCKYFSYGTVDVSRDYWRGMCIGCSAAAETFEEEIGFDSFVICEDEEPQQVTPAPAAVSPGSFAPVPCIESTEDINFSNSVLKENNLDGQGPLADTSGAIRYGNVGVVNGRSIDLKVTVKDGQSYQRISGNGFRCDDENAKDSSCTTGSYGTINNKSNMDTTFLFSFIDAETDEPVVISAFYFSVFDIDQSKKVREEYGITGFTSASYDQSNEEAIFQEGREASTFCQEQPDTSGNCLFAESKRIGKGCDNPVTPMQLGEFNCNNNSGNSKLRTFLVLFENKDQFELNWKTPCSNGCTKGRNFLFGFRSGLADACPTSKPVMTDSPRNSPTDSPTVSPTTEAPVTTAPTTTAPVTAAPTTAKPIGDTGCVPTIDHTALYTEGEVELRVDHVTGNPPSYWQITYKNGTHSGESVSGWCVDVDRRIQNRRDYHADMYSSYEAGMHHDEAVDRAANLTLVNWLINNIPNGDTVDATECGLGSEFELTWREYQRIIWKLVDFKDGSNFIKDNEVEECVVDMVVGMVLQQDDTYEPDCGDANAKIALLIVVDAADGTIEKQVLIAEVLLSKTGGCQISCDEDKQEPTTALPTTAAPVTPEPTTAAPVTPEPTTAAPVTPEPTTAAPVTPEPTTAAPVTPEPTTAAPTKAPTTLAPTTMPTTLAPVTNAPMTSAPTKCEPYIDHESLITEGEVELRVDHAVGDPPSYLQITYKNGTHSGDSVNGWCVDVDRRIQNRQTYHADMYSSYDANVYHTGAVDRADRLPLVNWMINNIPNGATVDATQCGLGTAFELSWREYQRIIWKIVDFKDGSEYIRDNQVEGCVVDLVYDMVIDQADANFEPDCGDANAKIALLIVVDADDGTIQKQVLIAELLLSDTKGCKEVCIDDKQEPTTASPITCTVCTDVPNKWLIDNNMDCTIHNYDDGFDRCNENNNWIRNNYCQRSCFFAGKGYLGDNCCEGTDDSEESSSDDLIINECTKCSDVPNKWLIDNNMDCTIHDYDDGYDRCNENNNWIRNNYCQRSCFFAGKGYLGDNCCEGTDDNEESSSDDLIINECTECSDVPNKWLIDNEEDCTYHNYDDGFDRCNENNNWIRNNYCQRSCFFAGKGYLGDNCCVGTDSSEESSSDESSSDAKFCKSTGDPHFKSFDGRRFDNHDIGWQILYEMGRVKIEAEHAKIRPNRKNLMNNRAWRISYDNQILEQGEDGVIPSNNGKVTLFDPMVEVRITAHQARWSEHENKFYYNIFITTSDYKDASGLCTTAEVVNESPEFPENPTITVAAAEAACAALVGTDEYDDCVADLRLIDDIDAVDDIVGAAATAAAVEERLVEDFETVRRFLRK